MKNEKVAIITVAGISSRFNEGIPEEKRVLKCLFTEGDHRQTLLYNLIDKVRDYDRIIVVGGYRFDDLQNFYDSYLAQEYKNVVLVKNDHYSDLSSGYSLYLGIMELAGSDPLEVLFVEGDLDVDNGSFDRVKASDKNVLTYNHDPIYTNKAVVLYRDGDGCYRYAFNSDHGLLKIDDPFSCIFNSGQIWKFTDMDALKAAAEGYFQKDKKGTNLSIIQRYVDMADQEAFDVIPLIRWTNCNTREDYRKILSYWRA